MQGFPDFPVRFAADAQISLFRCVGNLAGKSLSFLMLGDDQKFAGRSKFPVISQLTGKFGVCLVTSMGRHYCSHRCTNFPPPLTLLRNGLVH